jgi:hypothetical protein
MEYLLTLVIYATNKAVERPGNSTTLTAHFHTNASCEATLEKWKKRYSQKIGYTVFTAVGGCDPVPDA